MKPHPQNHSLAPAMQALRAPLQITLLVLGGVAGAIFITTFSLLGAISPAYAFMRDTISSLEFSPFGYLQQLNFVVFGLLQAAFAYALRVELTGGRGAVSIPAVQLICACAVVGDAVFIRYPAHLTCDLVAFNSTLVVLFLFAWRFWRDPRWRGWSWYSIATAVAMMACLTIFGICNRHGGPAGLFERLAVAIRTTWSIVFVGRLMLGHGLAVTPMSSCSHELPRFRSRAPRVSP